MAESTRVAAQKSAKLDRLLLDAKLAIPAPQAGFVSRATLITTARTSHRQVVAVTAPSGYGKSSFLAQWAAAEERSVGWVSLDRFDDDAVKLLTLLASAFVRATGADAALVTDMRGHGVSALGRAAPRLALALRESPSPFVLMLDDLHELATPACHDVLSVVLDGVPAGSQLVMASRHEQPQVATLRAAGQTLEIGADSLALDADGARRIFAEAQVPLTPALAAVVIERTEGWPVGLHLAAMIAHDNADGAAVISGDDRYVADYLYRESLASLPENTQRFLRCTAVLDQFSAELCDAVFGQPGSQARLRELEDSNVFLIPLDRRRGWFRYHPLFREFLLSELRRVSPALVAELHVRAAGWYELHGSPAKAIEHLLETPDRATCVRLVAEHAMATFQSGQMATVRRWIGDLGHVAVDDHPPLGVLAGWIAVMSGQAAEADRLATRLEGAAFDPLPFDGSASFESSRAMLRSLMCAAGPAQAADDAEFALAQEPSWSAWREQALCLGGEAELLRGDGAAAQAYFAEAADLALVHDNAGVQALSDAEFALIAMDKGRWAEAAPRVASAMGSVELHRLQDYAIAVPGVVAAARLALHDGDLERTERQLTKAMRARPVCTYAAPALATRVRLYLAKCYWALGDHVTARHLMREIDDILMHRPALGALLAEVDGLRELISASAGGPGGYTPLTPAELRLLPYLQTHLTIPEIGARLFVSRNTVSTEVGSIYRKLGVSSRSEAVEWATSIGLLGS
ncbi:LuxR family transcriptional regulator [Microterricola viridarii]|uniref:LuxR family transcriptional regulator n=1 Tax=Microterricola viridarii TaxID=412690 RepID=A0A0X8E303_9MICO|nr:LuxR family transcriptional regulator [Microterricola viridarii]AMB58792.1 LuxR family transcriptional regulator [Microterricola viridarii]